MNNDRIISMTQYEKSACFCTLWFMEEVKDKYKAVNTIALTRSEAERVYNLLHEALK